MSSGAEHHDRLGRAAEALVRFAAATQLNDLAKGKAVGLALHSVDATILGLLRLHGPLTPRELATKAGVSSSGTMTGAIDRLERSGWTCRTPCQEDRRKVFIALTDNAPQVSTEPAVEAALKGMSDAQLDLLSEALEKATQSAATPDHAIDSAIISDSPQPRT